MKMSRIVIFVVSLLCLLQTAHGKSRDMESSISELAGESNAMLLAKGRAYMMQDNKQDSAYVCLSIITGRHDRADDESSQLALAEAYMLMWELNLYYYSDYAEMFTALYQAEDIYRSLGKDLSRVYLNFGVLYQTIAEQYEIGAFEPKALDNYAKALESAVRSGNYIVADMAFGNSITMLFENGRFGEAAGLYRRYSSHQAKNPSIAARFNGPYYKLLEAAHAGDYDRALSYGDRLTALVDSEPKYSRYAYMIWNRMADIYKRKGDYANAARSMERCRELLESDQSGDLRVDWLKSMAALKEAEGLPTEATAFTNRYLTAKDSLLNARKMAEIDDMRFTSRIRDINREMEIMRYKNRVHTTMLWCGASILVIAIVFLIVLWRKNAQLRLRNKVIWRNTFEAAADEPAPADADSGAAEGDAAGESGDAQSAEAEKNKDREIIEKVTAVLESSPEVFSTDFSSETLARLTGINYKYISHAINETYGTNFSYLLGEYRVREACRRINHREGYLKLTVEAMATDVGFKSRTTFTTSFKRVIGMTPSEYIKTARQNLGNQ